MTTIARARTWRMRWRRKPSRKPNQTSGRVMHPGGRIGSNQELGIECSGHGRQGRGRGVTRWLARIRMAGAVVADGGGGIVDGLFGQDPELPRKIGGVGARGLAGPEWSEQAGAIAPVFADVSRRERTRCGIEQDIR